MRRQAVLLLNHTEFESYKACHGYHAQTPLESAEPADRWNAPSSSSAMRQQLMLAICAGCADGNSRSLDT